MSISRRDFLKKGAAATVAASALMSPIACTTAPKVKRLKGGNARQVLIISFDGISIEGFKTAKTPNIDALMKSGSASLATRDVMPSITLPNYTSHLLGAGPEVHGVTDNGWTLEKHSLPAVEVDEDGYFPNIFKVLKDGVPGIRTAFFENWKNLLYPHNPKYIDRIEESGDFEYPELFGKAFDFMKENKDNPFFLFLYTVHTDDIGHQFQWMSPEYIKAIEDGDAEVGILMEKLKNEGMYDNMHIMFISDHGGINYGHGGVLPVEMEVPWIIEGRGIKKGFAIVEPNNTVNTASTVARLFGLEQPKCWTGEVPETIFK